MKKQIFFLFASLLFFVFILSQKNINEAGGGLKPAPAAVCVKENCFAVEIADTYQEREIGLMNRKNMPTESGMFFIFEKEEIYNFWMKNTLIPLDIIWIDGNDKIIYIQNNAQPCEVKNCETFGPSQKAKYVLEINGGLAEKNGIKVGDEIELR
ncbi:DUF192 domain-containing protein [Patescibacteria group bacterium]|nr:DUF192 domain-containing protein [Patescibacteria group bacterium]